MAKNLILGPILAHLAKIWLPSQKIWHPPSLATNRGKIHEKSFWGPNLGPKNFFHGFYLC